MYVHTTFLCPIILTGRQAHIIDVVRWQSLDRNQWAECFMPLYECDILLWSTKSEERKTPTAGSLVPF
jgi:hypothetical protein